MFFYCTLQSRIFIFKFGPRFFFFIFSLPFFFFVNFQLFSILFFNQYFLFVSFLDLILILFVVCFMEFIFLFQFSPSIQNYLPFQFFSFKFYHHSLNFYFFFWIFCDCFFLNFIILTNYFLKFRNCGFFRIWCLQSNGMGHEFYKLTWVPIFFRIFFLFGSCYSMLVFFKNRLYDFFYFYFYRVILISWPDMWVWWTNLSGSRSFFAF